MSGEDTPWEALPPLSAADQLDAYDDDQAALCGDAADVLEAAVGLGRTREEREALLVAIEALRRRSLDVL